jgi:hypothetical protein
MLRPVQATLSHTMPAAAHTFLIDSILFDCLICGLPSRHFCRSPVHFPAVTAKSWKKNGSQRWLTSVSNPPRGNGLVVGTTRYQPASSPPQETGLFVVGGACGSLSMRGASACRRSRRLLRAFSQALRRFDGDTLGWIWIGDRDDYALMIR